MKRLYLFITSCCLIAACASQSIDSVDLLESANAGQPALHAIQDQELRELMGRMNSLMMERFMTEQEMDVERSRFARQIIDASKTLASTAKALLNKLPGLGLNAKEQSAFRMLAQKLEHQANSLQKQTQNRNFNAVSATLHDMTSTCMACHTLFRKL